MAIIKRQTQAGRRYYQVRVRNAEGLWHPSQSFATRKQARQAEEGLLRLNEKGDRLFHPDAKLVSLQEYWKVWKVKNRGKVSAGWKLSQDQMFRDYVTPVLGKKKLAEIGSVDILDALEHMRTIGRSEQLIEHVYTMLNKMFRDCVRFYKLIPESPVTAEDHRPKVKEKQARFLTTQELMRLLEASLPHFLAPAIWLGGLCGLRSEAIVALKWDSVFLEKGMILIQRAWKQKTKTMEEFPKGGKQEWVSMPPALRDFLRDRWLSSQQDPNAYVCRGETQARLSYNTFHHSLRLLCRKLKLLEISPHGLRHSSTELLVHQGATLEDLRRMLNHKSVTTTQRYVHRSEERIQNLQQGIVLPFKRNVPRPVPLGEQTSGLPQTKKEHTMH